MGLIAEKTSKTFSDDANAPLDLRSVVGDNFPSRDIPRVRGVRWHHLQTVFKRQVLDEIHTHGRSMSEVEISGVLVGSLVRDNNGPVLYIDACIRGNSSQSKAAEVTFTAETWQHIQTEMDAKYPDKKIVGWYHTHPGFGVFLSGMDLFIQEHFFNLPWQVAFVYDPLAGSEALFAWHDGKCDRDTFLVEEKPGTPLVGNVFDEPLPPRRWPYWVAAGVAFAAGFAAMVYVSSSAIHL